MGVGKLPLWQRG